MVHAHTGPPNIIIHPTSQLIAENVNITLTCAGEGKGSITYRWETSSVKLEEWREDNSTKNSSKLVLTNLQESQQYRCVVSNEAGDNTSSTATITVLSKCMSLSISLYSIYCLEITTHPQDRLVPVNSSVSLTCASSVSSDVTFSWTLDGKNVTRRSTSTGNTSVLTIMRVRRNNSYVCTVSHGSVHVMSSTSTLTVFGMYGNVKNQFTKLMDQLTSPICLYS